MSLICEATSRVKHSDTGRCVLPRYCNCWDCNSCRVYRLRRLMDELAGGLPTIFLTLTWRVRQGWSDVQIASAMAAAWAKWVAAYNREHGRRALQYMVVRERTKVGTPHMHIVLRAKWIPKRALSDFMRDEIDSPIVDVRGLKEVRSVARYLAKYLTKGPAQFGTLKRYWRTLDYLMPEYLDDRRARRSPGTWFLDPRWWPEIAFDAALRGFRVEHLAPGCYIHARPPP